MLQGRSLVTQAMAQENELMEAQQALERQRDGEEQMRLRLEQQEDDIRNLDMRCSTQEEMVQKLTKKLETLWKKYQSVKGEVEEVQNFSQQERNELVDTVRELTKELRLKVAILGRCIPASEYLRIEQRAEYDEVVDEWHIPKSLLAGNTIRAAGRKRPQSAAGRRGKADDGRYDGEEEEQAEVKP